jgi:hypothetical protein
MELQSGRSDMVITGGVDTINDIFMHMCFAKTLILSPTGDIRPFSKDADGTVLGEGIGMLVLKRLGDAEKDGDRIYAVIKGIGASSDGKAQSIYAPSVDGQAKAVRQAYRNAQIDPASVKLEGLDIKAVGKSNKLLAHIEDVNPDEDDFDDLIVQIEDQDGVFSEGSSIATVSGNLFDGTSFQGTDEICIVPPLQKVSLNPNENLIPKEYALYQNYPNPFNPTTTIEFGIPGNEFVILKVYNTIGQERATLVEENLSAGTYRFRWDASDLPSGIYYYQLRAGSYIQTEKMILIK